MNQPHDHARPSLACQRAVLATARVILTTADPGAAHQAASAGSCDACTVVAAVQFGFTLAAAMATAEPFVSERLARASLAAVQRAEAELRAAGN